MSKVTIVGVGALGSHVALALRNVKPGLKIIDFDIIEQKNILAQVHTKMSLRQNKALALQKALSGLFGVQVEAIPHRLTKDNAQVLLGDSSLIIDCTDNIEARRVISLYVRSTNTPCLHGGLSADGTFARIMWDDMFEPDSEDQEGGATCEDGEHLPFFMMASSILATTAQIFLKTGKRRSFQVTPNGLTQLA